MQLFAGGEEFAKRDDIYLLKEDIINRFGQLKHPTQVFDSLSQIQAKYPNGADGTMLATDNGHVYVYNWNVNSWKDFGVFQAQGLPPEVTKVLKESLQSDITLTDKNPQPPYDNLDTLPLDKIITYSYNDKVKKWPENAKNLAGTIFTLAGDTSTDSGAVQILLLQSGQMEYRIKWGFPAQYGDWQGQMISTIPIQQQFENIKPPYDDLNTLYNNTLTIYSFDMNKLKNVPSIFEHYQRGMVYTLGSVQGIGTLQLAISVDRSLFAWRIKWGNDQTWTNWLINDYGWHRGIALTSKNDIDDETKDVHSIKNNKNVTYGLIDKDYQTSIINRPSDFPATIQTINGFNDDSLPGKVQIAVDKIGDYYYSIYWFNQESNKYQWTKWKKVLTFDNTLSGLSLFKKIGIVGDSYASGELAFNGYVDHYNMSWGQILGRKIGASVINYSCGGQTTRGWLTDSKRGLGLLNSTPLQDLYILCLGINDFNALGADYLGAEKDIDDGKDTFFGNYGKIIKAILAKSNKAKMVIATVTQTNGAAPQYNDAINTIAGHFKIPVLDLNSDWFFKTDFYLNHMHGGHPTGPVYVGMANAYERLITQAMVNNISYFEDYENDLPTDNETDLARIKSDEDLESKVQELNQKVSDLEAKVNSNTQSK